MHDLGQSELCEFTRTIPSKVYILAKNMIALVEVKYL